MMVLNQDIFSTRLGIALKVRMIVRVRPEYQPSQLYEMCVSGDVTEEGSKKRAQGIQHSI
jgi:hypothetical protein